MADDDHSAWGPSSLHRRVRCLGSRAAEEGLSDPPSIWAAEGTLFHACMASMTRHPSLQPSDFFSMTRNIEGFDVTVDEEMVRYLEQEIDWVREQPGEIIAIEKTLSLGFIKGEKGTVDLAIIDGRMLRVIDYKYGSEPVDPVENEQGIGYALSIFSATKRGFDEIEIIIRQPRVSDGGGSWRISLDELLQWGEQFVEAYKASLDPDAPRTPGKKQCRWCRAANQNRCKEHRDFVAQIIGAEFFDDDDTLAVSLPVVVSPEQRSSILLNWSMVERWKKNLATSALHDALTDRRRTPGMKAILGRAGKMEWTDPDAATTWLSALLGPEKAVVTKPLTPAAARGKLTKEEFKELKALTFQKPARPVLVSEDTPGEAVIGAVELFDEEDESDGE